jgi:hypothetical protein
MSGVTYKMHHSSETFWAKPEGPIPHHVYSVGGMVQTQCNFESTITIPEGMWVLHSGAFGDHELSGHLLDDRPRNWVGRQRPRCINLGTRGHGLYLNHIMISPEPFAIIRGVPNGWSQRYNRQLTLLDIHDWHACPYGIRVESARQIHGDRECKWVEVHNIPASAVEKRRYCRSLRWVSISDAMDATEMSSERLLLDWWSLVRREEDEPFNPKLHMLLADSRERIHQQIVPDIAHLQLSLEAVEQLVADEATDWSKYWMPRGLLRDIMLLMQYNWHCPTRRMTRV